jgi:hypothetical protein
MFFDMASFDDPLSRGMRFPPAIRRASFSSRELQALNWLSTEEITCEEDRLIYVGRRDQRMNIKPIVDPSRPQSSGRLAIMLTIVWFYPKQAESFIVWRNEPVLKVETVEIG